MVVEKSIIVVDYRRLDQLIVSLVKVGAISNIDHYRWSPNGKVLIGPSLKRLLIQGK
jgi:hypothetical protein